MTRENDNLMFAICENDYDMVKESLENGADPNCENGLPLILAVRGGHVKILKLLRAYNVNFNPKNTIDTDFNPPMVIAASKGNVKMCEFL